MSYNTAGMLGNSLHKGLQAMNYANLYRSSRLASKITRRSAAVTETYGASHIYPGCSLYFRRWSSGNRPIQIAARKNGWGFKGRKDRLNALDTEVRLERVMEEMKDWQAKRLLLAASSVKPHAIGEVPVGLDHESGNEPSTENTESPNATPEIPANDPFLKMGLPTPFIRALNKANITRPTPMQKNAFETVMTGASTLIATETGSGKTLAGCMPIMTWLYDKLSQRGQRKCLHGRPKVVILAPTRELGAQIASVLRMLASNVTPMLQVHSVVGYESRFWGNDSMAKSVRAEIFKLRKSEVHVLVGTPGILRSLFDRKMLYMADVEKIVLDEADLMLTRTGFKEDVEHIIKSRKMHKELLNSLGSTDDKQLQATNSKAKQELQVVMLCASLTEALKHKAKVVAPGHLDISSPELHRVRPLSDLKLNFVRVHGRGAKEEALIEILTKDTIRMDETGEQPPKTMIFSNTTESCRFVMSALHRVVPADCYLSFYGEMAPQNRQVRWARYTDPSRDIMYIATTDLASRGLDNKLTSRIILFDFPSSMLDYLHRVGRIRGKGEVVALINNQEEGAAAMAYDVHRSHKSFEEIGFIAPEFDQTRTPALVNKMSASCTHFYGGQYEKDHQHSLVRANNNAVEKATGVKNPRGSDSRGQISKKMPPQKLRPHHPDEVGKPAKKLSPFSANGDEGEDNQSRSKGRVVSLLYKDRKR